MLYIYILNHANIPLSPLHIYMPLHLYIYDDVIKHLFVTSLTTISRFYFQCNNDNYLSSESNEVPVAAHEVCAYVQFYLLTHKLKYEQNLKVISVAHQYFDLVAVAFVGAY